MPFQLQDGKFLLADGKFATDPACCCDTCSGGATAIIESHATGSGAGCPTLDISDSITVTLPGDGFIDFSQFKRCLGGCTPSTYSGHSSYLGTMFCSSGSFTLFIQAVSLCCDNIGSDPCNPITEYSCGCSSANGEPGTMTAPGVYTFNFIGTVGGLTWNLDVTVTISFP
jgi:hypothetical protein